MNHTIKSGILYFVLAIFVYGNISLFYDDLNIKTWDWGAKYCFCVFNFMSLAISIMYHAIEKPRK